MVAHAILTEPIGSINETINITFLFNYLFFTWFFAVWNYDVHKTLCFLLGFLTKYSECGLDLSMLDIFEILQIIRRLPRHENILRSFYWILSIMVLLPLMSLMALMSLSIQYVQYSQFGKNCNVGLLDLQKRQVTLSGNSCRIGTVRHPGTYFFCIVSLSLNVWFKA